jgi:hypothetical protein
MNGGWRAFLFGVAFGVILCILLVAIRAHGQEHMHPPQDADIHAKFYASWMQPTNSMGQRRSSSCCNLKDCYPTRAKLVDGHWFVERREDHKWIMVPDYILEQNQEDPRESPDDRTHACMPPPTTVGAPDIVYCATLGAGN